MTVLTVSVVCFITVVTLWADSWRLWDLFLVHFKHIFLVKYLAWYYWPHKNTADTQSCNCLLYERHYHRCYSHICMYTTAHLKLNIAIKWLPLQYCVWSSPGSKMAISVLVYHGFPYRPIISWDSRTYFAVGCGHFNITFRYIIPFDTMWLVNQLLAYVEILFSSCVFSGYFKNGIPFSKCLVA
jgi:hypothetical protein